MKQTRFWSAVETSVSIFTGFWISVATAAVVLPLFNFDVTLNQNMQISAVFTLVSWIRGYTLRRLFEYIRISNIGRRSPKPI